MTEYRGNNVRILHTKCETERRQLHDTMPTSMALMTSTEQNHATLPTTATSIIATKRAIRMPASCKSTEH